MALIQSTQHSEADGFHTWLVLGTVPIPCTHSLDYCALSASPKGLEASLKTELYLLVFATVRPLPLPPPAPALQLRLLACKQARGR